MPLGKGSAGVGEGECRDRGGEGVSVRQTLAVKGPRRVSTHIFLLVISCLTHVVAAKQHATTFPSATIAQV